MSAPSRIHSDLIRAYRETEYRVLGIHPMVLHIDVPSAPLALLHQALSVDSSAFITACNPCSQASEPEANLEQQAALGRLLASRGFALIDGIGQHPRGSWTGEPGFLVPGMSLQDASSIGRQFRQNAIVWSGADAIPRLILLR